LAKWKLLYQLTPHGFIKKSTKSPSIEIAKVYMKDYRGETVE